MLRKEEGAVEPQPTVSVGSLEVHRDLPPAASFTQYWAVAAKGAMCSIPMRMSGAAKGEAVSEVVLAVLAKMVVGLEEEERGEM